MRGLSPRAYGDLKPIFHWSLTSDTGLIASHTVSHGAKLRPTQVNSLMSELTDWLSTAPRPDYNACRCVRFLWAVTCHILAPDRQFRRLGFGTRLDPSDSRAGFCGSISLSLACQIQLLGFGTRLDPSEARAGFCGSEEPSPLRFLS